MAMEIRGTMLLYSVLTVIGLFFLFWGLILARPFLVPLITAMVLALLMLPIANRFERWGMHRVLATSLSTCILFLFAAGFTAFCFFQMKHFADDWETIRENLADNVEEISQYLVDKTPLTHEQVIRYNFGFRDQESDTLQDDTAAQHYPDRQSIMGLWSVFGYLTNFLIVLVYVFLFIHFRHKFKQFILRIFPHEQKDHVAYIIVRSSEVSRRYLAGKLLLMVFLALLYFIGLYLSGLEGALLISIIAAVLSIIPVIGNLFGFFIAVAVSLLTNGGAVTLVGIAVTFSMAQIIDTYILQPIVLGEKLDVHPVFIILSVVLGYHIWGIMGMVLSIPIFGMITVVCRYVPVLGPFGYLFSKNDRWNSDT